MKGPRHSKMMRPWSWRGMLRNRRNGMGGFNMKLDYSLSTLIMLVGFSGLIIVLCRVACHGSGGFLPKTPDWDRQRTTWMNQNPTLKPGAGQRPRIMMATGSSPQPCESAAMSHALLQSAKNKVDYCRLHDIQLYYSLGNPKPIPNSRFSIDWWVTLPIIRMLMLQHPEVEWLWWVDADAVFTDMSFEPPFTDLKDYNLVLFREDRKDTTGLHTGNYLIRNCQWSLDLIQAWDSASASNHSSTADSAADGKGKSKFDAHKSAMVTSLLTLVSKQDSGHNVRETENWAVVSPHLEDLQAKQEQQQHGGLLPLLTHFPDCLPCSVAPPDKVASTKQQAQEEHEAVCLQQLDRTFDFADNQVYERYGFQGRGLGSAKTEALTKEEEDSGGAARMGESSDGLEEYSMMPRVTYWDEQRRSRAGKARLEQSKDKVMLVSGSAPKKCARAIGDQMLVRGLKNKIDYCRLHGIELFYNMASLDEGLSGWWSKLPLMRMLMLNNPEVEWLWWMDSDAMITDMDFEFPFESRYNIDDGYNMVMYGEDQILYVEKNFRGINTGNFLLRNCQWSIDLLDRWASFGTSEQVQRRNGEMLSTYLTDRQANWDADDQSVLVYLLIKEKARWARKVRLEKMEVEMSGNWEHWTPLFRDHETLSNKPFVTHFAGCTPCGGKVSDECLEQMDRTLNFADNQVLQPSNLCHENLRSPKIVGSCGDGLRASLEVS